MNVVSFCFLALSKNKKKQKMGPGFCNTFGHGQWNLGTDLDNSITNSINRAVDDVVVPQVNLIKKKANDLQTLYSNLGNYLLQKLIIIGLYIILFLVLAYFLYSKVQTNGIDKVAGVFKSFY